MPVAFFLLLSEVISEIHRGWFWIATKTSTKNVYTVWREFISCHI